MSSESIQHEIMASEDDSADAVLQGSIPASIPSTIQTSFSQQNEGITTISTVSLPETMSTAEAIVATESISVGTQVVPDSTLSAQVIEDNISQVQQHEPVSVTCSGTQESIVISTESVGIGTSSSSEGHLQLATLSAVPSNYPWATRLHDCELIGDSYRGYVTNEVELDLILTLHKQHTNSCWGTRQSPSSAKPSIRLMWKSQYVPYDGIPFLNTGRRATVMECQYGPRRKGAVNKKQVEYDEHGSPVKRHRPTCPARIYVKKVRKFPEFRIDPNLEGKNVRQAQERALTALRLAGVETGGEERYYVQLPLPIAHEYHDIDDIPMGPDDAESQGQRLNPDVMHKIRELVARGVTGIYTVKHCLKEYVEKELFVGMEPPPRHNKSFFPTIIDIQNHIHQAQMALATGALLPLPPLTNLPTSSPQLKDRTRKRKQAPEKFSQSCQTTAQAVASIQSQDESDNVQSFTDQEQREIMEQSSGHIHQGTEAHHLEILHSSEGQTSDVDLSSQPQILITQGSRAGREDGQVVIVVTSNNLFTGQSDSDTPTTLSLTLPASQVASLSHASLQSGTGPAAVTLIPQQINTANSTTSSTNSQTVTFIPQAVDSSRTAVTFLSPDEGPDNSGQVSPSTAYLTAQGQSGSLLTVLDSAVQASVGGTAPVIRVGTNLGVQIADGSQIQNTVPGQILASQAAVEAVLSAATSRVERQQSTAPLENIQDEPPSKRSNLGVDFASLVKEAVFDGQQVVNGQEQTKATPKSEHSHLHMVTTAMATASSDGTESQQIKLEADASQNFIPMESHSVVMVTQPVLPSVRSGTGIVHVYQDSNSSLLGDGDDRLSTVDSQLYSDAQHTVSMSQSTVTEQVEKATLSHAVPMDTTSSDTRENDTNQTSLLSDEVQNTQSYEFDDQPTNTTAGEQDSLHIMFENGERISEEASGIVPHSTNTQGHVNLCSVQLMNTASTVFTQ